MSTKLEEMNLSWNRILNIPLENRTTHKTESDYVSKSVEICEHEDKEITYFSPLDL